MRPNVPLAGDDTPEMSEGSDDNEDVVPTGDLAELSQNVGVMPAQPVTAASTKSTKKTGKNKGVGKGASGSSGHAPKRPRHRVQQPPPPEESDSEQEVEVDETGVGATQHITVGVKKGYSVYPGYLFDVPPKRIKVDYLRKQFMINEIAQARAERRFYRHGITFMSCCKEFLRVFCVQNKMPKPKFGSDEHGYAMGQDDEMELSDSEGSNIDMQEHPK